MLATQVLLLRVLMVLSLAVGVFLFVRLLFPEEEAAEAKKKLGVGGVRTVTPSIILKISRPLFLLLTPVTKSVKMETYRSRIRRGFITAGMTDELTADEFFAFKLVLACIFPLFVGQMIGAMTDLGWYWYVGFFLYGFVYPDMWLKSMISRRHRLILRQMPYTMDLLTLSVEAGLDFVSGIAKVVEKGRPGPLIEELSFYLHEIQVGTTRSQALRNFSYRINMAQTSSFSALLIQADQLGASIGPVLRAQSDLLRTQRFQAAEKAGAAATQKILFPLVLCIMPAVFIVIFGPIALNFVYGTGNVVASSPDPGAGK